MLSAYKLRDEFGRAYSQRHDIFSCRVQMSLDLFPVIALSLRLTDVLAPSVLVASLPLSLVWDLARRLLNAIPRKMYGLF